MFDLAVIGLVCIVIGIGILSATRPSGMMLGVVMLVLAVVTLAWIGAASASYTKGAASWYEDWFGTPHTANGEIFRPDGITAAHKTLPFGTCLRIVGPNGKAVHVRINDRGPYHGNRVLDLSRGAAKATGLYSSGVAIVRYKRVDPSHCE